MKIPAIVEWQFPIMNMRKNESCVPYSISDCHEEQTRTFQKYGEITSTVDGTEKPTKDNESNFGAGYGYQYGSQEGTIEIYMNDKWWIYATEEVRQQIQFPYGY